MNELGRVGRAGLLDIIACQRGVIEQHVRELARVRAEVDTARDYQDMLANLTVTQARCTELLVEVRAYRASGICLPGWTCLCGAFNGSAREKLTTCRCCGVAR